MTPQKLFFTLKALGIRVRRESGGFALYFTPAQRLWASTPDEAFDLALANLEIA